MFGTKQGKEERLERMVELIAQHPGGLSQSEIARRLRVERSTVYRDLAVLEARGVLLAEDQQGHVSFFRRLFGRP